MDFKLAVAFLGKPQQRHDEPIDVQFDPPYFLPDSPINPTLTRRGQSWPRQLWPHMKGKLIKCLKNIYYCRNVFRISLKFWHDLKKWRFDVLLTYFCQKSSCSPSLSTPPFCSVFTAITDHPRAGEVRLGCRPQSGRHRSEFPGCVECRRLQIPSLARSLALSKCTVGTPPIWASSQNQQTL